MGGRWVFDQLIRKRGVLELLLAFYTWVRAAAMVVGPNGKSYKVVIAWGKQIKIVSS